MSRITLSIIGILTGFFYIGVAQHDDPTTLPRLWKSTQSTAETLFHKLNQPQQPAPILASIDSTAPEVSPVPTPAPLPVASQGSNIPNYTPSAADFQASIPPSGLGLTDQSGSQFFSAPPADTVYPSTWITADGRRLENVRVVRVEQGYVIIVHKDGTERIAIETLRPELRTLLHYDGVVAPRSVARIENSPFEEQREARARSEIPSSSHENDSHAAPENTGPGAVVIRPIVPPAPVVSRHP